MAIIRNERPRRSAEPEVVEVAEEEEIDYTWHPTEEEFSSPITSEQWAELLADPQFAETDAARSVRCLRDYGEPATFQQLSIRYRGTMGRYRRWLSEAAQAAGKRFGVSAPQQDQFGMDEWWPLLYRTRATGKPGANVFEMELRSEVLDAYELIDEQERQEKRAQNARQLQRIEQLERARKEERERRAQQAAKAEEAAALASAEAAVAQETEPTQALGQESTMVRTVAQITGESNGAAPVADPLVAAEDLQDVLVPTFPALNDYLDVMAQATKAQGGSRYVAGSKRARGTASPFDASGPLDYALRYAERLRSVLALMREGNARVTAAAVARAAGDKSVGNLQDILNGQKIPDFDYVDSLKTSLLINPDYLEAPDGQESSIPAFCTYRELLEDRGGRADFYEDVPQEIAYVVDDSRNRRTGVIVRFSDLRCALLSRVAVEAEAKRDKSDKLDAFVRMVDELDAFAREKGIVRTSRQLSAENWDKLANGRTWPGSLL